MELRDYVTDLPLYSGEVLKEARLVYAVWGKLNPARDNLVLYPTRFGGTHEQNAFLIGDGMALDPKDYCIIVPNMLGNGVSSSPSDQHRAGQAMTYPAISHADNIALQMRMLADHFGAPPIALAFGWSMGAQQACYWAVTEPDRVQRLMMVCGTARTTPHNRVFLESLLAALEADPRYRTDEPPLSGLRAVGRIYAGWAYSQPWLKQTLFRQAGYTSLDDWLTRYWDALFMARDAGNLTTMIETWINHDVADGGDLAKALGRIKAKTGVMTTSTDLYFTPADCRAEAKLIPGADYQEIDSIWGHMAGSGQSPGDTDTIDRALGKLLND